MYLVPGVYLVLGGYLIPGVVHLVPGVYLVPGGVPDPRGVYLVPGVSGPGGCGIPACTEADTPLPVNRMTNRCKNITLATTSLRPVKIINIGIKFQVTVRKLTTVSDAH